MVIVAMACGLVCQYFQNMNPQITIPVIIVRNLAGKIALKIFSIARANRFDCPILPKGLSFGC